MDAAAIIGASRRERELYQELNGAYGLLAGVLRDDAAALDPGSLAAHQGRAEAAIAALRAVAAELAPHRMTGARVPAEARELWRASAALAAEAARASAELLGLAEARRVGLAARLAQLAAGKQGLAAYRPPDAARAGLTDRRA
jgi:hypothetical protein